MTRRAGAGGGQDARRASAGFEGKGQRMHESLKSDAVVSRQARATVARAERYAQSRDRIARRRTVVVMALCLAFVAAGGGIALKSYSDQRVAAAEAERAALAAARDAAARAQAEAMAALEAQQAAAAAQLAALEAEAAEARRRAAEIEARRQAEARRAAEAVEARLAAEAARRAAADAASGFGPAPADAARIETASIPATDAAADQSAIEDDAARLQAEASDARTMFRRDCVAAVTGAAETLTFFFAPGETALSADQRASTQALARLAGACPGVRIEVRGHADQTGDDAQNLKLSWDRASAVVATARAAGLDDGVFDPIGFGARRLSDEGETQEAHAANRRVEFRVAVVEAAVDE